MSAEPLRQQSPAPSPVSAPAAGASRAHHGLEPARGERFAVKTWCASSRSRKAGQASHESLRERASRPAGHGRHRSRANSGDGPGLLFGYRLVTYIRASINALQAASALQNYPEEISGQLSALCDRLEARAYSGQALADLQNTVRRFDQISGSFPTPETTRRSSPGRSRLWHQYRSVIDPVISFTGQPYTDSATGTPRSRPKAVSTMPRRNARTCSRRTTPRHCRRSW